MTATRQRETDQAVLRVGVVDDSPVVRSLIAELLGGIDGVDVVGVADSMDAGLELLLTGSLDLVTVDLRLGANNGIDMLRRMGDRSRETTVIVLTNFPFSSYRRQCEELGASYFLDKTSELHLLSEIVRERLTEARARQKEEA